VLAVVAVLELILLELTLLHLVVLVGEETVTEALEQQTLVAVVELED
jgi:hypothetical protein